MAKSPKLAEDMLAHSDLCRDLSQSSVQALLALARLEDYTSGQRIIEQGQRATSIYLPCSGSLRVERVSAGGQRQVMGFLFPGDFLGFNSSGHFLYGAAALEASAVLCFPTDRFEPLLASDPKLRENLSRISNAVLTRLLDHLFAVGQKRAHARLAFFLFGLWRRGASSQQREIRIPMTRADIGDYLGLTLETTSRAFTRLRDEGIISSTDPHRVAIVDPDALGSLAEVD